MQLARFIYFQANKHATWLAHRAHCAISGNLVYGVIKAFQLTAHTSLKICVCRTSQRDSEWKRAQLVALPRHDGIRQKGLGNTGNTCTLTSLKLEVGEAAKNLSTVGEKRASVERGAGLKCNRCGPPSVAENLPHTHAHTYTHYTLAYTSTCSAEERGASKSVSPITPTTSTPKDERVDFRPVGCLGRTQVAAAVSLGQIGVRDTSKARNTYAHVHNRTHTHTHAHTSSLVHSHRETSNVARVLLFQVVPTDRRRRRRRGSQMRNKHVRVRSYIAIQHVYIARISQHEMALIGLDLGGGRTCKRI